MARKIKIVLSLLFLFITQTVALFNQILKLMEKADGHVDRVRTLREFQEREDEFVVLDFIGLIERYDGYTAEEYDVKTEDGYFLKLHRISGSPSSPKAPGKPVVYLQHGLIGSSDLYVFFGRELSLAFLLADAGYDVWLGNARGNTYSKRHIKYTSERSNKKFWSFSMDDIGTIDVPKLIDATLEKTKQSKLAYIGYSMGTTVSYIMLSAKPEYNDKLSIVIHMAPVGTFGRPYNPLLNTLLSLGPGIKDFAIENKIYEFLPQSKILRSFAKNICLGTFFGEMFCGQALSALMCTENLNMTALPTIFSYFPAGASLYTIYQYYQMIENLELRKFDFGEYINKEMYGTPSPPKYDLSKITAPHALIYAVNDGFVTEKDVKKVQKKLKNVVAFIKAPDNYKHLDFVLATNAGNLYKQILELVAKWHKP